MRRKILLALFVLSIPVLIYGQEFKTVRDGIEYAEVTRGTEKEPVHINLLRLDLKKVRLDVVHALDAAIGLEKTSSIASRHGALAAINAGFFKMDGNYKGDAAGVLMIDRRLLSESYANRTALMIRNKESHTDVLFNKCNAFLELEIKSRVFQISGINRERKENEIILYTPDLHRTTLTDKNGLEIVVERERITKIADFTGSNIIPPSGFVISASGKFREELKFLRVGQSVEIIGPLSTYLFEKGQERLNCGMLNFEDVVGGVPQLISSGKIDITWEQEKINKDFVTTRHPRTAVAKLKDGKFLMITVDGRQAGYSVGMNLEELATFLLEQGAVEAMNLDGGGSTTMFLDGKVTNKPSDKEGERSVSDAILVFPRKK